MPKNNPPNQSLDNRLMQRIKDLPRPDERYAKWEIRAELDDIHQLIQDEVVKELESLKRIDCFNEHYSPDPRPGKIVSNRISALREDKE